MLGRRGAALATISGQTFTAFHANSDHFKSNQLPTKRKNVSGNPRSTWSSAGFLRTRPSPETTTGVGFQPATAASHSVSGVVFSNRSSW